MRCKSGEGQIIFREKLISFPSSLLYKGLQELREGPKLDKSHNSPDRRLQHMGQAGVDPRSDPSCRLQESEDTCDQFHS